MKPKTQFIESLEARVAPALLINGGNLLGGAGNPTTGETSTGANQVTLVKVLSGQALVFFNNGTISGISVGKHTQLDITGDIAGDIVTNLGPNGRLTDANGDPGDGEDGALLTAVGIKGITTHPLGDQKGDIGRIIAGGQIKNINIAGNISGIYAGDGIFRDADTATVNTGGVDFNTVKSDFQNTITFYQGDSAPNGNAAIKNVTINTARQLEIFSGSGAGSSDGAGLAGSNITNVTITKTLAAEGDKPVVFLHAGDGGAGADGGAGGSITSFNDQGSIAYVKIQTGHGGEASSGTGGKGGSLLTSTIVSSSTRYDLLMGDGGSGQKGGVGGGIDTLTFNNNISGGKSLLATADFNNDGQTDVVLLNTLTGEATVSLGTDTPSHPGEANFQEVTTQLVTQADGTTIRTPFLPAEGANPTSLVVTDLNGDGLLDFVVSFASTNSLGIYTNTSATLAGTFSAVRQDLSFSPTSIVAGDFSPVSTPAGTAHANLAIVSALNITSTQSGLSSDVYLAHNDGTGHLLIDTTPAAILPGTATAAAAVLINDPTTGAVTGTNLFVGTKTGNVYPVQFLGGTANVGTAIAAFPDAPVAVPVNALDAIGNGNGDLVLAFSKDVNAGQETGGDTTLAPQAAANVFTLNATGDQTSVKSFLPTTSTTTAHFLAGSDLVGTVAPGGVTIWAISGVTQDYTTLASLTSADALSDFSSNHLNGTYQIAAAGAASNRFDFTAGNPGATDGIKPFLAAETDFRPRVISLITGNGGDGDALSGGTGGSVKTFAYKQTLDGGVVEAGGTYTTSLVTGHGGSSNGDVGGKGGGIRKADISMMPAHLTYGDDTSTAIFRTGAGGRGTDGGDGGSLQKVTFTSVQTEAFENSVNLDAVALNIVAGNGGEGTSGTGGGGGNILLAGQSAISGVSFIDDDSVQKTTPALLVTAGDGGQGITAGGVGGSLDNVGSQNVLVLGGSALSSTQLASAQVSSGNGGLALNGDGGAGGTITSTNVTADRAYPAVVIGNKSYIHLDEANGIDGAVAVKAGNGGVGRGGVGGAGGTVTQSTVGSVSGDVLKGYGAFVKAGFGGDGDAGGGAGGSVNKVKMSSPEDSSLYAAVIAAGDGGNALAAGAGGAGGNIAGIKQIKDVNSAITVLQAGNGGRGAGDIGGVGGSVTKVNTVGFIGVPSSNSSPVYYGTFAHANPTIADPAPSIAPEIASLFAGGQVPQGIFAGQGADGAENGAVFNIVARQIAAIGASVQANGTFVAARSVDNVSADLIGYDAAQDGLFQSANGQRISPSTSRPLDGFILASEVSNVNTINSDRTGQFSFAS